MSPVDQQEQVTITIKLLIYYNYYDYITPVLFHHLSKILHHREHYRLCSFLESIRIQIYKMIFYRLI